MQTYNAHDVREQRISFKPMTEEQFCKIINYFIGLYPDDYNNKYNFCYSTDNYYRFYKNDINNHYGTLSVSYLTSTVNFLRSTKEISFEEFSFAKPIECFKEGEEFYISSEKLYYRCNHWSDSGNMGYMGSWDSKYIFIKTETYKGKTYVCFTCKGNSLSTKHYFMVEINEFKQKVSIMQTQPATSTEKEIIGYKFKPNCEQYRQAAEKVAEFTISSYSNLSLETYLKKPKWGTFKTKLENSGLLDLWFEPIYATEEEVVNMGQFNLTIKEGKVYHKTEDITKFVKGVGEWAQTIPTKIAGYAFNVNVDAIMLNKTGCESHVTNLKNWLNIYNKIK